MKLKVKEIEGKFHVQRLTFHKWKSIREFKTEKEATNFKEWLLKDYN